MRYALNISFDGTEYHGWQIQENAHTVQAELEKAMAVLLQQQTSVVGCGRTDTGVHAREFVLHFDLEKNLPKNFVFRLNSLLPFDISVNKCAPVSDDFNARFDAIKREYRYYLHFNKNPFLTTTSWYRYGKLDFDAMNNAATLLLGYKQFTCFCKGEAPADNYFCHVYTATWEWNENGAAFCIVANRFLRNMVRAIVGTLIEIGTGDMNLKQFEEILRTGTRSDAGSSVPAHGLFLEKVEYPEGIL